MLIQRACLGLFPPGKWWSTCCTSTRYITHPRPPSVITTVVEVKHIFWTGLQVQPISATNVLPCACASQEAMRKKAVKVLSLDHEVIVEEASKHDRLEYKDKDEDKGKNEGKDGSEEESK
jgi:hypothetical protein